MGLYSTGTAIAGAINRNYKDFEFTAAVILRELIVRDDFIQIKPRFTDDEWEMIMQVLVTFYYDHENIAAQTVAWALRDLISNDAAITFVFAEDDIMLHPDYDPDNTISLSDALWETIIAFD